VTYRAFRTTANTRTGAVVRAPGRAETTFLGAENNVDPLSIAACADYLNDQPDDAVLAICGSIPLWTESKWNPLREVLESWAKRRVLIVDTYGPPLSWCAALAPKIIKINRHEFAGIAGVSFEETGDDRMPELLAGVSSRSSTGEWIITDGPNAVWFCEKGTAPESLLPPKTNEKSQTGSGDVFLAGIIHATLAQDRALKEAVAFALPLAAANAGSEEVATFDLAPFGF
jgi:fructose-1-phosphate kinase PfkB-like protein